MPWLLREDAAVKEKLSGVSIVTSTGHRAVPVTFQYPETEVQEATYPAILVDRVSVERASDREHRGFTSIRYRLEDLPNPGPDDEWGYFGEFPIPYNIDYQVTVLARFRSHLVEICNRLSKGDKLPARGGYIEIPGIEVVASLDVLNGPDQTAIVDTDGKRLYSASWLIRVYTEMFPWDPMRYEPVKVVSGRIRDFEDTRTLMTFDSES